MSFIDKMKIKGVSYDIQDTDARKSIEDLDNNKADKKDIPTDYATNNDIQDIETIIDIITPKSPPVKGELVHITDALGLPVFETKTSGNVKQETTTGKNLCYKVTLQDNQNLRFYFDKVNRKDLAISFTTNEILTNNSLYLVVDGVSKGVVRYVSAEANSKVSTNISLNSTQLEEIQNGNESWFLLYKSGAKFSIPSDVQIELGSTASSWEKYTGGQASPNPEFPQEVEVIEGDLSYKVNGNNLINTRDDLSSVGDLALKKNDNGTILLNGTLTSLKTMNISKPQKLKAGVYTLSLKINDKEVVSDIYYLDNLGKQKYLFKSTSALKISFNENVTIISVQAYFAAKTYTNETLSLQLETGEVSTEYEPYQEQIVPLDLKGNWVGKASDSIKDYLVTDKKKYWLVKNVNVREYSSKDVTKSGITYDNIDYARFTKPIDYIGRDNFKTQIVICDRALSPSKYYDFSDIKNIGKIITTADKSYFWIGFPKGTTEEEMKEKLSNFKIYYQLTTPQIIDLGELPEPIKTFEGTNNIQVLANLDTEIEVKYALDLKKYYDNKLAEISAQII